MNLNAMNLKRTHSLSSGEFIFPLPLHILLSYFLQYLCPTPANPSVQSSLISPSFFFCSSISFSSPSSTPLSLHPSSTPSSFLHPLGLFNSTSNRLSSVVLSFPLFSISLLFCPPSFCHPFRCSPFICLPFYVLHSPFLCPPFHCLHAFVTPACSPTPLSPILLSSFLLSSFLLTSFLLSPFLCSLSLPLCPSAAFSRFQEPDSAEGDEEEDGKKADEEEDNANKGKPIPDASSLFIFGRSWN